MGSDIEVEVREALFVSHHMVPIVEEEHEDIVARAAFRRGMNGLFDKGGEQGAILHIGIHTGWIWLTVQLRNRQPDQVDFSWDSVVEIGLHPLHDVRVSSVMGEVPDTYPVLVPGGDRPRRLRAHARGRDANIDGVDSEAREEYLIQVWPEGTPRDTVIHKAEDARGAQLRNMA